MLRLGLPLLLVALTTTVWADVPNEAVVLDSDLLWDPTTAQGAAVSPDGQLVAYISKGAIWSCKVAGGPPTKLVDLPDTITAFLAKPEYESFREKFAFVTSSPGMQPIPGMQAWCNPVLGLAWTPSQDGVVYAVRQTSSDGKPSTSFKVLHTTLDCVTTEVTQITKHLSVSSDSFTRLHVTTKRTHVVFSCYGHPYIWDAENNHLQATCYDYVLPSATSGRYLAVEIDTRELVLVADQFRVSKRFNVILDQDRQCDLFWSADERYAVCRKFRSSNEPGSDICTVFRIDLQTGERRDLNGGVKADRYHFTGKGGEVVRLGITGTPPSGYGDGTYGAYLEMIPDGNGPEEEFVRFINPGLQSNDWHKQRYPPILANTDGSLFLMAWPRFGNKNPGFEIQLIERSGKRWRMVPDNSSLFISPWLPVAFADKDRVVIGRTADKLFSVPVESLRTVNGVSDE